MDTLKLTNVDSKRLFRLALGAMVITALVMFNAAGGFGEILGLLSASGVKTVPGLGEALSTVSSVYGVQQVVLSFLGVTIVPWLAAIVAGVGAVGT